MPAAPPRRGPDRGRGRHPDTRRRSVARDRSGGASSSTRWSTHRARCGRAWTTRAGGASARSPRSCTRRPLPPDLAAIAAPRGLPAQGDRDGCGGGPAGRGHRRHGALARRHIAPPRRDLDLGTRAVIDAAGPPRARSWAPGSGAGRRPADDATGDLPRRPPREQRARCWPTAASPVIDWDEVMLAPPERDLMFVRGSAVAGVVTDAQAAAFEAGYGTGAADPSADRLVTASTWAVQDLADFAAAGAARRRGRRRTRRHALELFASTLRSRRRGRDRHRGRRRAGLTGLGFRRRDGTVPAPGHHYCGHLS